MKTKLLLVILFALAYHAPVVNAQKPAPEQKPDVSNKALITKETPGAQKNPSPKSADTRSMKQYTIERFMDTTRLCGSSISADETSIPRRASASCS